MNILKHISVFFLISLVCILLLSCGDSSSPPSTPTVIQTIQWQLDGKGFVQFYSNDAQYYNYLFWNDYTQTNQSPMTTVTAAVMKQSGSLYFGYGIVFCYQDNNNFYRLLINAAGQYSVYARIGGNFTVIVPWTTTPSIYLNSGFGVENLISVTQQSPNNFSVNFNGKQETLFSDSNFIGGTAGFAAGIDTQSNENFPITPEDIRFKFSLPVFYP
jgi:hypothetical protein